ncbi:hypothetical protein D0U04_30390 [Bacillus clarus]|uniref:Uncharacterized protein n=1 Tax=Bacillus clarus TaxID=2338372 RepID=A0ABX9KLY3_9BACI|nr:hypothetical protein D0U04_30390 [Bacillus clarus]
MSTKFFISFAAFDVVVISDSYNITLINNNSQWIFIKNFIFYKFHLRYQIIYLNISSIIIYKQPIKLSMGCYSITKTIVLLKEPNNFHQYKKGRFPHLMKVPVT